MLTQISPNIYILPFDSHRDRPNLGYIHGEKYSVLLDAGNSEAHLTAMLVAIEEAGLPAPAIFTNCRADMMRTNFTITLKPSTKRLTKLISTGISLQ